MGRLKQGLVTASWNRKPKLIGQSYLPVKQFVRPSFEVAPQNSCRHCKSGRITPGAID